MSKRRAHQQPFESLNVVGGLLGSQLLVNMRDYQLSHQSAADYGLVKGLKINDEITRYWRIARAYWDSFQQDIQRNDAIPGETTRRWITHFLADVLQYPLEQSATIEIDERSFPIRLAAFDGAVPVVISKPTINLDQADEAFGQEGQKRSPASLIQEYLNATDKALWGIVSDGKLLRVYRDNPAMTRLAWLEIDFERLFDEDNLGDFAAIWLLLHTSRLQPQSGSDNGKPKPANCILESWRESGQKTGERALESLRDGVSEALRQLGTGFLQHPQSEPLRSALQAGELSRQDYYNQLLRLVYRLLFLLTAERREVALLPGDELTSARSLYTKGYSVVQLADRSGLRRHHDKNHDAWQLLKITFEGFSTGQPRLAQPALGGIFAKDQCKDIDKASIDNEHLFEALRRISWFELEGVPTPINYRELDVEEFGSVYESLLEQEPQLHTEGKWRFSFLADEDGIKSSGNERKKTGSYYTPDSLVQELIKSALVPVLQQKLADNPHDPESALLSIKVVDPACGSGHFLLAAARRIARELVKVRHGDGSDTPDDQRRARRDVISHCIFGVDRNPMALELARTALWLEGLEVGQPLSFLNHHLRCGDALLGLTDLKAIEFGIPKAAFKALSGDKKAVCTVLGKLNTEALKDIKKKRTAAAFNQVDELLQDDSGISELVAIELMPQENLEQIEEKAVRYKEFLQDAGESHLRHAADMLIGAFLLPKTEETESQIPTTADVFMELVGNRHNYKHVEKRQAAVNACTVAGVFHWPLAFPQVFSQGGFDCVLGNPPWERVKLQEQEFFATRNPDIALAKNKAERTQRIQWLSEGMLGFHLASEGYYSEEKSLTEIQLYSEFVTTKRTSEAASAFMHVKGEEGGRFSLTGVGDVNTYALFSETILQIMADIGRAGFIVPTGIATDDSTKAFFGHISQAGRLVSLFDLENREGVFPAVHRSYKFCLLTLGKAEQAEFAFFAAQVDELADPRRRFKLTADEFRLINPNTLTCPVFRSERDAELTKKLYRAAPVLIAENKKDGNPWGIEFMRMLDMSNDSHLFENEAGDGLLPLYEAKMIHQYDHRWATYEGEDSRNCTDQEKSNPDFSVTPRYWIRDKDVANKLAGREWTHQWFFGWRGIARTTDERSVISSVFPYAGVGNSAHLLLFPQSISADKIACLHANTTSLVIDFVARQKIGGANFNYFIPKQLPVLAPLDYTNAHIEFIVPRVLELTYTSHDLQAWAEDHRFHGEPFPFNSQRRDVLRAELDAFFAKRYGLHRDELRYVLDPSEIEGDEYPSETFRVLKKKEKDEFGEYRTQRLVLEAWDKLEAGELH